METFMLWYDASNKPLSEKVKAAAHFYRKKYGRMPDLCLVHPSEGAAVVDSITVRPWRGALPHHLCIGVDEAPEYVDRHEETNADQARERAEMHEIQAVPA